MEQLIEAFGIDARLIVIQIINFLVLMALLSYFLYKPLLKLLADREEKIKQGIQDAEQAARVKASAEEDKKDVLSKAHTEAQEVAKRATVFAEEKTAELLATAQEKAEAMIRDAERKGAEIKARAEKESEAEIAKTAILAAEKILREKAA